ncbi:hypothetical protein J3E68DRAFT_395634 [Trichoderma sp. SZMC 28012]
MPFLYLQMSKAHANELKQAKLRIANGLDESTKQVSIGYTLRRYWCPRRKARAKEYKQLCGCTSRQPASLFFLFPYPYWNLLILLPWILISASYMAAATGASNTREEYGFFLSLILLQVPCLLKPSRSVGLSGAGKLWPPKPWPSVSLFSCVVSSRWGQKTAIFRVTDACLAQVSKHTLTVSTYGTLHNRIFCGVNNDSGNPCYAYSYSVIFSRSKR